MMWQVLQKLLWLVASTSPMLATRNTGPAAISDHRRQRFAQHQRKKRRIIVLLAFAVLQLQFKGLAEARRRFGLLSPLLMDKPQQIMPPRQLGGVRDNP